MVVLVLLLSLLASGDCVRAALSALALPPPVRFGRRSAPRAPPWPSFSLPCSLPFCPCLVRSAGPSRLLSRALSALRTLLLIGGGVETNPGPWPPSADVPLPTVHTCTPNPILLSTLSPVGTPPAQSVSLTLHAVHDAPTPPAPSLHRQVGNKRVVTRRNDDDEVEEPARKCSKSRKSSSKQRAPSKCSCGLFFRCVEDHQLATTSNWVS